MTVVCNTSPLILLAKIERLSLMAQIYSKVLIPQAVWDEVTAKPGLETDSIRQFATKRIYPSPPPVALLRRIPDTLGAGERAAIATALAVAADLVILDDQQGRQIARAVGLQVTGTIGVLVRGALKSTDSVVTC